LVVDFGLAKLLERPSELTRAGDVMGKPSYMPPEQASDSSRVTAQSDVYSLGATLYQRLAGRPPFQSATAVETLRQVQDAEPVHHGMRPMIGMGVNNAKSARARRASPLKRWAQRCSSVRAAKAAATDA